MNKIEFNPISYREFCDFLESDLDELDYFKRIPFGGGIIPLEEYWKRLKAARDSFVEEIKPLVDSIKSKNEWISKIIVYPNFEVSFVPELHSFSGVDLKKKKNSEGFKNVDLFDMNFFPFSFFSNFGDSIESAIASTKLQKNSRIELLKIMAVATKYFAPQFSDTISSSNMFEISNNTWESKLSVQKGFKTKNLVSALLDQDELHYVSHNLRGSFIDLPYDYKAFDAIKLIDEPTIKKLTKKIYCITK